ncbi:ABC transporter ATP-binding protein [Methylobacterium thuringiense]|uniref:Multidrug ABC transporter ATP-binding protein n=1 Tax=Methylobacterium thuringiense TaxID=1003091 RepID=A0ABQ4TRA6_9HYPH|nr:ABC transporter ATP-binding protein [Methylobacterium thuringiense]GJE57414.1 hypothetical protein EKPJFOCH_3929 [Methylobacterium thuringiense]
MERDPILFAWSSARRQHATAVALGVGLGAPLALFALLCLRDLICMLSPGQSGPLPFLALALPFPGEPARLFPIASGFRLSEDGLELAALVGLAASALAFAGLGWLVARVCFSAQARAATRLRAAATDAILRAPPGAREDVRALPALIGAALAGLPAAGILVPAMTLAAILLALLTAALAAPRLVPAVAIGLFAIGLARALQIRRGSDRSDLRQRERAAAEAGLGDLILRMPAVRAHGSAMFERRRLGLRARATHGTLARAEGALAYARAPALALAVLLPAILVATALWRGPGEPVQAERVLPGALAAAAGAFVLAAGLVTAFLRLWFLRIEVTPTYRRLAQTLDGLTDKRPAQHRRAAFPASGALSAADVGAYDPASGERLTGLAAHLRMPSHVAIVGGRGSGAQALAALLAGQIEPSVGAITYGGVDLRSLDPSERAHRIAFAGSEAILIEGTLKQNLLYGARTDEREALGEKGRIALLKLSGLDALIYARGLEGTIDPDDEPAAAAAIVAARSAVREALAAQGMARLVEPFDPALYNHQAAVGENILFGEAVGPTFSEERLARHPYLRAVLEAEGLTRTFVEMGLSIARSTVEIFSDLPDDHPLFDAFSLFPARERGFFEDLIARQPDGRSRRRGPAGQRDRERLIGLTLRYSETRHRFGLIDAELEERIVAARRSFARLMPPKFREKVDLYDPARVTAAASLEENVLFGRITQGEAGAEGRVRTLVRQVLAEQGLEPTVYRLGLASRVTSSGPGTALARRQGLSEAGIGPRERVAIDLVRCLVRRPDILVVGLLPDERKSEEIAARIMRLRMMRQGMGLIVCLPDTETLGRLPPFDAVLTVARNTVTVSVDAVAEDAATSHAA